MPISNSSARPLPRSDENANAEWMPMNGIHEAASPQQLDDVRALMRGFVAWHRRRHVEDLALIDSYFDAAAFERELAGLPGKYAPPKGRLLIAYAGGQPAGCVALRDLGDGACEMKRMFVPEEFRGRGLGRALAERVLNEAQDAGYRLMRLDTSWRQKEAIRLYEGWGFHRVPPYYAVSDALARWLVFFERKL